VNHFIDSRENKQALARGEFIQPIQQAGQAKQTGWVDEKQRLGYEHLGVDDGVGAGVDMVATGRKSAELPSYREALKR